MKGRMNTLIKISLLIYVMYSLVDRFIVEIPNIIAIPIMILVLVMIIIGLIKKQKTIRQNEHNL